MAPWPYPRHYPRPYQTSLLPLQSNPLLWPLHVTPETFNASSGSSGRGSASPSQLHSRLSAQLPARGPLGQGDEAPSTPAATLLGRPPE